MPNPASAGLPHPASYTDLGDGTVRDNVTGLVWQKAQPSQTYAWADAKTYCSGLTLAGRTWHLPTRIELISIVDFTRGNPQIDTTAFPGTVGGYTWTSSPWVVSQITSKPQDAWMINFADGFVSNSASQSGTYNVRCVSSSQNGPMPKQYTQVATGEMQDNETGLIWVPASSPSSTLAQSDAESYCSGLGLNGHTWRLPSIKELSTTVDETPPISKVSPAVDTGVFPDTPNSGVYMSSSMHGSSPWALTYTDGITTYSKTAGAARCVR